MNKSKEREIDKMWLRIVHFSEKKDQIKILKLAKTRSQHLLISLFKEELIKTKLSTKVRNFLLNRLPTTLK